MATIYVIENTLRFNSEAHTLHSIKSNERMALAIPASLCFDLLIRNQGRIVTQAELLQNAWGERGMSVTPNTLYQNISLLRKSLNRFNVNGTLSVGEPENAAAQTGAGTAFGVNGDPHT